MKGGLSWCWDRVSGRKSKQGHGLPMCSPTKRKTSLKKRGLFISLFLFFSLGQKKGPGYRRRKRYEGVRAVIVGLDRRRGSLLSRLSSDVPNQAPLNQMGNRVTSERVLNVFCFYGMYGYSA